MTVIDLEALEANVSVGLILFGHNARVWDCYISDSVSFTLTLFLTISFMLFFQGESFYYYWWPSPSC